MNLNQNLAFDIFFGELSKINQYLEEKQPWKLAKDMENNRDEVVQILSSATVALLEICEPLSLFLPDTADKIHSVLTKDIIEKAPVLFTRVELEGEDEK